MDLSRIRVRGKRKTPGTNIPAALQSIQPIRAMKAPRRSLASVMSARLLRPHATLDALPDEILESIFLYSANLSLPRASNLLGKRLSGRATLLRLIIWAFHDTWTQWFGIPADPAVVYGPRTEDGRIFLCDGDPVLQTKVLEQPWVNVDLILQAQQVWADKNAQGSWYQHSIPWDADSASLEHDFAGGSSHFNSRTCFEADYRQALTWPAFAVHGDPWTLRDIHPRARIPTSLITGPWDEAAQRTLFWLCRGGFRMARENDDSLGWHTKIQLLRNAILDAPTPNVLVINCLVNEWVFTDLPPDVVRSQLLALERRLEWGGDSPDARDILRRTRNAFYLFLDLPDPTQGAVAV